MGLFKRGQVWWMSFIHRGKQVRKPTNVKDKRLAEKIYHKVMTQLAEGQWLDKLEGEGKTFKELADKYINEYTKGLGRRIKRGSINHLIPFFGEMIVTEISPKVISAYKGYRYQKDISPSTINRELTIMKHMYTMAVREWEWCRNNPVKRVRMEKEGPPRDRWLTYEEEKKLLDTCPAWLREIVTFALNTGLRQSHSGRTASDRI